MRSRAAPPIVWPRRDSVSEITASTPGFEHVKRFWNKSFNCTVAKILPGEYYVSHGNELIATVLGSCVSACVRDRRTALGAMNHFMLPEATSASADDGAPFRYGAFAMEHMLNDLFRIGVRKQDLEVKIAGGGAMLGGGSVIGDRNVAFVKEFLGNEGIEVAAEHTGSNVARNVLYDVRTGKMLVKQLAQVDASTQEAEKSYRRELAAPTAGAAGDIDLF